MVFLAPMLGKSWRSPPGAPLGVVGVGKRRRRKSSPAVISDDNPTDGKYWEMGKVTGMKHGHRKGSIEAVRQALQVLPQDNVALKFLLQATGDISASDIDLAVASKAIVIGFNVRAPGSVKRLLDAVEFKATSFWQEEITIGTAEVRATFTSGSGRIAGCMVKEGKVEKGCGIRVVRDGRAVYVGTLDSLRRVKEMVKEVNAGLECGMGMEDYNDWEVGDIVQAFNKKQKKRTLEEASASMTAALEVAGCQSLDP
ncbi:Translation initiation factor IF-2, chloroplastic [Vitis vinifera]|uniref:Translation initiation factor IF-2, chloroplastic n=1 Tax=Vitis vinifera TaxID=29760 RepID=A0A438IC91_VITVI|nr:Translation initiation factor IF-2, chloroplastic [Vitis vinifera]